MKKTFKHFLLTFFALVGMTVVANDLFTRFEIEWGRPPLSYWRILALTLIIVLLRLYEDRYKPSTETEAP